MTFALKNLVSPLSCIDKYAPQIITGTGLRAGIKEFRICLADLKKSNFAYFTVQTTAQRLNITEKKIVFRCVIYRITL